jgi:anti-sigma factor RsiW
MINCKQILHELNEIVDDEITVELRSQMNVHLHACPHCKVLVDTTKMTLTLVSNNSFLELPQGVSERLLTRLTKYESGKT